MHTNLGKKPNICLLTAILLLSMLFSCTDDPRKSVDVKEIDTEVSVRYFHRDFFAMDKANLPSEVNQLEKKYPHFFPFYRDDIMGWEKDEVLENCRMLLNDSNVLRIQDTLQQIFGDYSEFESVIKPAFKRFSYHFPDQPVPEIVFAYTEFLFRTGTDSQQLVLAPEMCLGGEFPVYGLFNIPSYVSARLDKYHLPSVAMNAWLDECFGQLPSGNRFLDHMIREGKKLYFMELMLSDSPDSLRTDWTTAQLDWLRDNEVQMWTYYIDNKYLYSTDAAYYMPLLSDGPFTAAPNIPPGSAPRIGAWTGWLIVKKFMDKNPSMSLEELFGYTDSDAILRESGYRP